MKTQFILSLLLLSVVTAGAKTIHKIENPTYVGIYDGNMKIVSVRITEEATVLTFQYSGEGFGTFSPKSYIVDEQGNHYELIGQKGFNEDSLERFVPQKKGKYELRFQPLPANTRIFDFIEDFYNVTSSRFYGIRKNDVPFTVSNPLPHNEGEASLPDMDFKVDSVLITGHIKNYVSEKHKIEKVSMLYSNVTRYNAPVKMDKNGKFKMKIRVDGPTWDVLQMNGLHIPIMLYPKDSVNLQITLEDESNRKTVQYSSKLQKVFSRLMQCAPMIWTNYYILPNDSTENYAAKFEQMTPESIQKRFDDYDTMGLYLSGKYGLNRIETEMLRSYFSLLIATEVTALTSRYFSDLYEKESPGDYNAARNKWKNSDTPFYDICISNIRSESNAFLCVPYRNILLSRFNMNHMAPHYKHEEDFQYYQWETILGKKIEPSGNGDFPGVTYSKDEIKKVEEFEKMYAEHYNNWLLKLIRKWRNKGEKSDVIFEQAYFLGIISNMPMAPMFSSEYLYQQFTLCRKLFTHPSFVKLAGELLWEQEKECYQELEEWEYRNSLNKKQ